MIFDLTFIVICLLFIISVSINVLLFIYFRKVVSEIYQASEEASIIFTRLETFQEHLTTVYEMPTFYGDDTLNGLLQHVKDLTDFLVRYEDIYSFTQPDLLEQLKIGDLEEEESDETQA